MTDQTLKNQKGNIHLWCLHKKWVGRGVLKICHVFADSIILNNRSIANFCGRWKWEGHLLAIFGGCHKWVTSKTIIIFFKNMFGIKTRPIFPKFLFNYKTYGNLSFHPCHKYQEQPPSSGIYFFKANNGTARTMCGICSKLTTIKTPERGQWRHPSFFIVNFEHIWYIILVSPLLNLNKWIFTSSKPTMESPEKCVEYVQS